MEMHIDVPILLRFRPGGDSYSSDSCLILIMSASLSGLECCEGCQLVSIHWSFPLSVFCLEALTVKTPLLFGYFHFDVQWLAG